MQTAGDILIADDDMAIVELIAEVLREAGYAVRSVYDGQSAIEAIAAARPALVLLDFHMPGARESLFLEGLHRDSLADLPMVVMTADSYAVQQLSAQGRACLAKPFALEQLLDCVAGAMPLCERAVSGPSR